MSGWEKDLFWKDIDVKLAVNIVNVSIQLMKDGVNGRVFLQNFC